jgi:hypothetical protein
MIRKLTSSHVSLADNLKYSYHALIDEILNAIYFHRLSGEAKEVDFIVYSF